MPVCEDFTYIGKRLREIEQETRHAMHRPDDHADGAAPTETERRAVDFVEWFGQMVRSI